MLTQNVQNLASKQPWWLTKQNNNINEKKLVSVFVRWPDGAREFELFKS